MTTLQPLAARLTRLPRNPRVLLGRLPATADTEERIWRAMVPFCFLSCTAVMNEGKLRAECIWRCCNSGVTELRDSRKFLCTYLSALAAVLAATRCGCFNNPGDPGTLSASAPD